MSNSSSFETATRAGGMRRVTERHPYVGNGIDSLTAQLNALLKSEKQAQRVVLDVSKDYIHLEKLVKGSQEPDDERYHEVLRSRPMVEMSMPADPKVKVSPYATLAEMFRQVSDEGLEVSIILVGDLNRMFQWVHISPRNPKLFGVPVRVLKELSNDVFLVCGAEYRDGQPEDIMFSVKGVIP